ncbi:Neuronal acetylcholine receptor subunit alpha-6-like 2, partial [Homarus americanus]
MRLIVIILQVAWIGLTECRRNPESEKQLRKSVLQDYDKLSFPPSGNTSIKIFIHGISIHNLQMHEDTHSLEVQSLLSYGWTDLRLRWDLSEHMDLDRLGMEPDQIWKPDLAVYNTVNEDFRLHKSQLPLLVYPDGSVMFEPPVHLHFTCVMDLTYWPHDTHNCSVMIGSWVHNGFMMDMEVTSDTPKWEVVEAKMARMTHHYSCCNEPYVAMKVSLLLRRSAPAYAWSVKTPALCMCILTVVLFLLPPGAGEKLVFGGLCLILDLLFIAYTSNIVSHAPTHTPLI